MQSQTAYFYFGCPRERCNPNLKVATTHASIVSNEDSIAYPFP